MRIYEASITYKLVGLGETTPLDSSEKVYEYLKGAFEEKPPSGVILRHSARSKKPSAWTIFSNPRKR